MSRSEKVFVRVLVRSSLALREAASVRYKDELVKTECATGSAPTSTDMCARVSVVQPGLAASPGDVPDWAL